MTSGSTLLDAVYQPLRDIIEHKGCGGTARSTGIMSTGTSRSSAGSNSSSGSLQHPHPALHHGRGGGGALLGGLIPSPPTLSTELSDTQQMPSYLLSTLDASGNANNQRANFTSSLDSRDASGATGGGSTAVPALASAPSSLLLQRAASSSAVLPRPASIATAGTVTSSHYPRSKSLSNGTPAVTTLTARPKQFITPPTTAAAVHSNDPSCQKSGGAISTPSEDSVEVVIEERRKRVLSDGTTDGSSYTVHRYIRGRLLGKGGFAKVYLCTAVDTNKHYAVKVVPKANLVKARARQKLQAEIKIHRMLKNKHVCEFKHFFEDRENCYILLELCHNQSMNEMIKRRKRLTEPEAAYFMAQLLVAVQYMHDCNVIHRDLKLGNLFLDRQLQVKVGDLGLATRVDDKDEKRKTICGTPNYIAPEIIQSDKAKRGHSFEVDVWSMGVILYTILIGKPPYEAKNVKATYQRILKNEYSFPPHVPISSNAKSLIVSLLRSDPAERPSLEQITAHPFLSSNMVPLALPSNALHFAPQWSLVNDRIELVGHGDVTATSSASSSINNPNDSVGQRKPGIPRSSSSSRQPFGSRDVNTNKPAATFTQYSEPALSSSTVAATKPTIDMERVVRTAMALSAGTESAAISTTAKAAPKSTLGSSSTSSDNNPGLGTGLSKFKSLYSCGFKIFDESSTASSKPPPSQPSRSIDEAALVQKTKSLSISTASEPKREELTSSSRSSHQAPAAYLSFASSSSGSVAADTEILQSMVNRLETALDVAGSRKGAYRLQLPRSVPPSYGPRKWVVRYVDYTSKYGLGFLLNDGSSGVYFNDSTKTVLGAEGDVFQYMERKYVDDPKDRQKVSKIPATTVETHTLSAYPESLKKKVTLLKHFRNYLMEQYKEENELFSATGCASQPASLVYVKKWVRTRHAILFRLSDHTVQVVFFDQSELLLTPDDRYITYVDKNRKRTTYPFTDELVGSSSEFETRIKYTKEILSSLLQRR